MVAIINAIIIIVFGLRGTYMICPCFSAPATRGWLDEHMALA